MPGEQFDQVQIHLADNRSNPAVLQGMDVPTRFTDWPLASGNEGLGRKPAVLRKNAVDRVAIEPTFLGNEKKSEPESLGLSFNQARKADTSSMHGRPASEREPEWFSTIP